MPEQHNSDIKDLHDNLWPTGWYLYENGQFVGPLSADEAFKERGLTHDGKPRLVSRKGFAQWYPVQDLASIYSATVYAKEESTRRLAEIERQMAEQAKSLAQTQTQTQAKSPDAPIGGGKVTQKAVNPAAAKERQSRSAASMVPPHSQAPKQVKRSDVEPPLPESAKVSAPQSGTSLAPAPLPIPSAGAPVVETKAPVTPPHVSAKKHGKKNKNKQAEQAKAKQPETKQSESKESQSAKTASAVTQSATTEQAAPANDKARFMHDYLVLRGRMRLGKLRNPWVSGFFNCVASVGIYFYFWFADTYKELTWHCQNRDKFSMPPVVLCMIPGIHFYMLYRLAQLAAEMEQQNKYQTVSPWLTVMYGLFPPFAVTYLQDAINRHWMLHVRHSVAKN